MRPAHVLAVVRRLARPLALIIGVAYAVLGAMYWRSSNSAVNACSIAYCAAFLTYALFPRRWLSKFWLLLLFRAVAAAAVVSVLYELIHAVQTRGYLTSVQLTAQGVFTAVVVSFGISAMRAKGDAQAA
jgi:hypothetical protein